MLGIRAELSPLETRGRARRAVPPQSPISGQNLVGGGIDAGRLNYDEEAGAAFEVHVFLGGHQDGAVGARGERGVDADIGSAECALAVGGEQTMFGEGSLS